MRSTVKPFKKILIINRGEIAVRAIRACRELGISVGVIYSRADVHSLPVKLADEAFFMEGESDISAYLDQQKIVDVARTHRYDAVYPGYGFLAENSSFAALCAERGIAFIGPSAAVLHSLGDKVEAKRIARKVGAPLVPGEDREVPDDKDARDSARKIGYPIVVKASGGGGGRGIRVVMKEAFLLKSVKEAQREAKLAFHNPGVYIEKFIENPRHVEFQILGDRYGNVIHLGERDCSVQRRHQKLIEEAPSTVLTEEMRQKIGAYAIAMAREVGLVGVATVESRVYRQQNYCFIEVNPRIQVEHGVTELICGIDLVKWQIRVAQGEKLSLRQKDIVLRGHAIECRINSEDPLSEFAVSTGVIEQYLPPGGTGVRVCGGIFVGQEVSSQFDTLLLKLMVWDETRAKAIERMRRALGECIIEGVKTTLPFHRTVMDNRNFQKGDVDTDFIPKNKISLQIRKNAEKMRQPSLLNDQVESIRYREIALIAASVYKNLKREMGTAGNGGSNAWVTSARKDQM